MRDCIFADIDRCGRIGGSGMTWLLIPLLRIARSGLDMVASNFVMYIMRVFRAGSIMKIKVNRFLMVANMVLVVLKYV